MDRSTLRLIACAVSLIAVSFGLARYGYGLLLPEIRRSFDVSNAALGLIATAGYVTYLVATAAAAPLVQARGPRATVVLGGVSGVAGMCVLGIAASPEALAVGVGLAGVSGGLVLPPLADVITERVSPAHRSRALAAVSAGTGWGVALSVPIALTAGADWRLAWIAFAAITAAVTLWAAIALRKTGPDPVCASVTTPAQTGSGPVRPRLRLSWFVCPRSGPLLVGVFVVGTGASVYWTFAADFVVGGPLPDSAGPALLACVGIASVLGTGAGDLVERVGGRHALWSTAVLLALSVALLVVARGSWLGVLASGVAFGAGYNLVLAVQVIWTTHVFAERPSAGLAGVMFMLGLGQVVGPALAGVVADAYGTGTAFAAGAAVIGLAALALPREEIAAARVVS